jgi:hypothetical protein
LLSPPPRDETGRVIPHDHPDILPEDWIIRRISDEHIISDENGQRRISTVAFRASSEAGSGMSIDLQRDIEESGKIAVQFVTSPRWIGSVRFTAQQLRGEALMVGYNPLPPENPHHGEVWGQFPRSKQKKLRELARWFVPIPGVTL